MSGMSQRVNSGTVEELLGDAESEFALLADVFEMSLRADERPLSHGACVALMKICRARSAMLRVLRRRLPAHTLNQTAARL